MKTDQTVYNCVSITVTASVVVNNSIFVERLVAYGPTIKEAIGFSVDWIKSKYKNASSFNFNWDLPKTDETLLGVKPVDSF